MKCLVKKRNIIIGFCLAVVIIVGVGIIFYHGMISVIESDHMEDRTYTVLEKIDTLVTYLKDIEISRRSYLLTGNRRYLRTYNMLVESIDKTKKELRQLMRDNPVVQQQRLDMLEPLIARKLILFEESITLMQTNRLDKARQADFIDKGENLMEAIRNIASQMRLEEEILLQQRSNIQETYMRHMMFMIILGSLLSLTLLSIIFYLLNSELNLHHKTEKELEAALKIKSDFTSVVSHELRTPLTAIKEGIAIVSDGTTGAINPEQREFLDIAKHNVDRLSRLINDILDFQKLESGRIVFNMQENDINEIIREIEKIMAPLAKEKGLDFMLKLDEKLPKVRLDKDKIIQVLINILNNSIKFTEKGSITVTTASYADNFVRVTVEDTGLGINEEDMPRLFQKFTQLEKGADIKTGGTGLGLAISKEIIEQHTGKIWAEPRLGGGATFHFTLPVK